MTSYNELSKEITLAIVGMAGRFPDATNVGEFWQNLLSSAKSIRSFSDAELTAAGVPAELLHHPDFVKAGTILNDIDAFDAPFFGFTPREAETMDPQSRLFLQCAWEALEDAGYDPDSYDGLIGVFAGKAPSTYLRENLSTNAELRARVSRLQIASGNDADALASMVAYKLNLRGPSVSVQTFCSTSLVAVHLGCQSLLAYESDMVLAGGVAIDIHQGQGYLYQEGGILSADGTCRSFDAHGNGSVMGSGLGVVALKRLADAEADGDHIYALIRGSALNNDGITRVSYAAPGLKGQAEVIAEALGNAGVEAESIGYIETHGTGTPLGDSVELGAMDRAFRQHTEQVGFCAIGSVKPNIGHLDRASGVTGLIKASLALQQQLLPPSLNCETPHHDYDWGNSPFYVNTRLQPWVQPASGPRRAGVSSFGMGGTNVHMVLEEAQPSREIETKSQRPYQLLLLSAKSEGALERMTANLAAHLEANPGMALADVAYTLQVGRSSFNHRRAVVCADGDSGVATLRGHNPGQLYSRQQSYRERPVAFLFPGVGDHYAGMGQALYEQEAVFRHWVDECAELLQSDLGCDVREHLYPAVQTNRRNGRLPELRDMLGRGQTGNEPLQATRLAQTAVFVTEYALARLLQSWGIEPEAMVGHSVGEYVAACVAGVFSLEDALKLVARRAVLIETAPQGGLLTVSLPADKMAKRLPDGVWLSGVLTPEVCVVGGELTAVSQLAAALNAEGISCRQQPGSHAFHTPLLAGVQDDLKAALAEVTLNPPQIPYLSNVTGDWITAAQATDPNYWAAHLCQPVEIAAGMEKLLVQEALLLLEVGPGQGLSALLKQHPACGRERLPLLLATMPHVYEGDGGDAFLLTTLGKLWLAGVAIDWHGYHADETRQRVSLPTYPFEPLRFWVKPGQRALAAGSQLVGKKEDYGEWFYLSTWRQKKEWSPAEVASATSIGEVWLLFEDEQRFGAQVAHRLEASGATVFRVQSGAVYDETGSDLFQIDVHEPNDYQRLLHRLPAFPTHVLHLWGIDGETTTVSASARFADAQQRGFYSLIFLLQAIEHYPEELTIWAVTANGQMVTGTEVLCPERTTILGACRVIAQENANISCGYIDVEWPVGAAWRQAWLADQLLAEIKRPPQELAIAFRGRRRWAQAFDPVYLPDCGGETAVLRQHGVYLITGGLGGVGLILADYLAQKVQARLILTTRSVFPQPEQWNDWLAGHGQDDVTSRKIRRLQEIEAAGGMVSVMQADVRNLEQMQQSVAAADALFGTLHGVFHAAGVSGRAYFDPVQMLYVPQCEAHFAPKAHGLFVLEEVLAKRELDFCLLFSSLSSILGGLGFAAYTAANLFIDAFVAQHNQRYAQGWISVNWDTWHIQDDAHAGLGATVAEFEMQPAEALHVLERVLANGSGIQLVNSTGNLEQRLDQWVRMVSLQQTQKTAVSQVMARPDLMTPYVAPGNETEALIAAIWEQVLGIAPIGSEDNFLELGGHSLMAMEILSALRRQFQVQLPLTILFDAPTVRETAVVVELTIIEELEEQLEEETMSF